MNFILYYIILYYIILYYIILYYNTKMKGNIRSHVGNHLHGGFLHWLGISILQRSLLKQPVYTFKENVYLINKP